jgi:hypothetical protein
MNLFTRTLVTITLLSISKVSSAQIYGDALYSWDFAGGMPSNWEVGVTSTNSIAHWEYRGPETTPNNSVGARGSCAAIALPISSLSQSNGFIIFDGNYWDDPGSLCGSGLGTGPDPAPHTAWVVTNSIDLTGVNTAVLTFQQQYRHFQATTKVFLSTDEGVTWTEIVSNTGTQSPTSEWKSANISQLAGNQPSVRFKFQYEGTYYWWLLDDITVYKPNDNDLRITKVNYTNNQLVGGLPTLFDLEYDQYPLSMSPELKFRTSVLNVGGNTQTGVRLNARLVRNESNEVYNQTSANSTLSPSQSANLSINGTYVPNAGVGEYEVFFRCVLDSLDDTPENNIDSLNFSITPFTYAKDEGAMEDTYSPIDFYDEFQVAYGNFYENKDASRFCHTIQVGVAEGTEVGKEIRGVVYNQSLDSLLGYTENYTINYGDINEPGEERLIYLDFQSPFNMMTDSIYFFAVEEIDSIMPFRVARSGSSFGESSLVRYNNINASIISTKSFLVRLTVLPAAQQPGCTDPIAMNFENSATTNDGSCDYPGCTNEDADNFLPEATFDDGTCLVGGCTDSAASNYNPLATYQNVDCIYRGCTVFNALNYNPQANEDDGSCTYLSSALSATSLSGCPPFELHISSSNDLVPEATCEYRVDGASVFTDCEQEFDYLFENPGIYEVSYSIAIGNALADTSFSIEVFSLPDLPLLSYNSSTHEVECSNCAPNTSQWFLDDQLILDGNESILNAEIDGITQNGYYTLIATNNNGCSSKSDSLLVVQPHFAVSSISGCAPFTVYFNNLTDTLNGMTCSLNTSLATIDNFNEEVEVFYQEPGVFTATLTCSLNDIQGTESITISASSVEIPNLILDEATQTVACSNAASFTEFTWNVDGQIIEGGASQPLGGEVYQLQAYNEAGCGGSSLLVINSTNEIKPNEVILYPNPSNDVLNIRLLNPCQARIFNSQGNMIWVGKTGVNTVLQVETWPAGLYHLQWNDKGRLFSNQFEIIH